MIKIAMGILAFSIALNSGTKSSLGKLDFKHFSLEEEIVSCIQRQCGVEGIFVFHVCFLLNLRLSIFLLNFSSAKNSLYFSILSKETFLFENLFLEKSLRNSCDVNLVCLIEENLFAFVISILRAD
jgi:hypothetical protein